MRLVGTSIFYWLMAFFVRFSTRGVQKHHKNLLEKVHVKRVEGGKQSCHFFLRFLFYRVFGRFSA
jgi:hypothetical protein